MRGATCFSGIGAPEVAMPDVDWIWHAEVEKFPCAVMAHHHPGNVNLGDVLAPDFIERAKAMGPLDLMVGGPPCQAFSIAGLRGSMSDPRGNLSLRWVQILHAIRPSIATTENVPGWLSTPDNAFGCFLAGIVGADAPLISPHERGRWPNHGMVAGPLARAAWRVLDAQYVRTREFPWAVPQRRRRVFVVVDLGAGVVDPAAVLFDRESLLGNPAPRRETGQGIAPTLAARTRGGGGLGTDFDLDGGLTPICGDDWPASVAPTLNAAFGSKQGLEDQHIGGGQDCSSPPVANCLTSRMQKGINTTLDEGQTLIPSPGGGFDEAGEVAHSLRPEGFDASEQCAAEGCEAKAHAKGFCKPHYSRWKRHGDPLAGRVAEGEPLAFLEQQRSAGTNDCILWPYGLFKTSYPSIYIDGVNLRAHRVMCEWENGAPEQPDLDAAHSCGNRACINPRHLRWATRAENMADAIEHGTTTRGERHGGAVLDEASVLKIVARLNAGDTHQAIADDFEVSRNTVTDIAKGKNWSWLTGQGTPIVPCYGLATQQEPKWAEELCPTLQVPSKSGGGQPHAVAIQERAVSENPAARPDVEAVAFDTTQITHPANHSSPKPGDACHPLASGAHAPAIAFSAKDHGGDAQNEVSPKRRAGGHSTSHANAGVMPAVAFDMRGREGGAMPEGPHDTANLRAASGGSSRSYVAAAWQVRRLTPRECESLQGFPDNFTAIPWRGKPAEDCPDGPRYKALGNSMAVNVLSWLWHRITTTAGEIE